jgi:hypothetical protein
MYLHTWNLLKDTVRDLQNVQEYDCDPAFVWHVLGVLYNAMSDMESQNFRSVHNRLRDLHYEIFNKYL